MWRKSEMGSREVAIAALGELALVKRLPEREFGQFVRQSPRCAVRGDEACDERVLLAWAGRGGRQGHSLADQAAVPTATAPPNAGLTKFDQRVALAAEQAGGHHNHELQERRIDESAALGHDGAENGGVDVAERFEGEDGRQLLFSGHVGERTCRVVVRHGAAIG
jgi:hypothetical protein